MTRRTIIVAARGNLAAEGVALARSGTGSGAAVLPIEAVASRLAGGFLAAVDGDTLAHALSEALGETEDGTKLLPAAELGDLAAIHDLPGFAKTLSASLRLAWSAGLELSDSASRHPRLAAMTRIEKAVLERLPPSRLRPSDLAARAAERLRHAPAVLGAVEFRWVPDLDPCWRPLVIKLAAVVPVTWNAGVFPVPDWLKGSAVTVRRSPLCQPAVRTASCATPRHEAVEALRWARELIAERGVPPQHIAIAAASTEPFDDFVAALSEETDLPVWFAHGRSALQTADGQAAAALADVLLRGLSLQRVRRLLGPIGLPGLPDGWSKGFSLSATLASPGLWAQALSGEGSAEARTVLMPVVELLDRGPSAAAEAGERLLTGLASRLWRSALDRAPGSAIESELAALRVPDSGGCDPEAAVAWMPASTLASTPRPHAWLLGMNSQSWPRVAREDPLLPDRIMGELVLRETGVPQADRRSFAAIEASAAEVVRSFSRRDAGGRLLGRSPLLSSSNPEFLQRTRIPTHAMSEPDRLLARPSEFGNTGIARSANACWENWRLFGITAHDGAVRSDHPAILRALARTQSAKSLSLLLRNPMGFVWTYALGMTAPEVDQAAVGLDRRHFGTLVHGILDRAVTVLEAEGGVSSASPFHVAEVVAREALAAGEEWKTGHPVPPALVWAEELKLARIMAANALLFPMPPVSPVEQKSWTEVPFGSARQLKPGRELPWDPAQPVTVPGTDMRIEGRIDRMDVGDRSARVTDAKTGRRRGEKVLDGGRELQRCLYGYAVRTLLGPEFSVESALLFPSREEGKPQDGSFDVLPEPEANLAILAAVLHDAAQSLRRGNGLPGIGAGTTWQKDKEQDDLAFALPVRPGLVLARKKSAAQAMLPPSVVKFWGTR